MKTILPLSMLAVMIGLQPVYADHDHDDYKHRSRSGFAGRQWQPSVVYPPYRQTHQYGTPTLGIPPISGQSFVNPGVGYPSYAPQPNDAQAQLDEWYLKYLGRYPEPAAVQNWLNLVYGRAQGQMSEVQIGIMASPECFGRCNNDPATYVQFLFFQITGRQPSRQELHTWVTLFYQQFQTDRGAFCRALINNIR